MRLQRRGLARRIARFLPKFARHFLMRRIVRIPSALPLELNFRIARTREDLEAAYRILHDSYVEMGYSEPEISGLRLTKFFALPTTTTLIACWNKRVVGTMSVIRQSPFGLPMEKAFSLSQFSKCGEAIAEVSSLAIHQDFRLGRGRVLLPLCKFFYNYVRHYMNLDAVVIAVNPSWSDFYQGLLMFRPLSAEIVPNYGFANGAPAVGLYLNLKQAEIEFRRAYSKLSDEHNLHKFFVHDPMDQAQFPTREFYKSIDPVMTPDLLNYFFRIRSPILETLSQEECRHLSSLYPLQSLRPENLPLDTPARFHARFTARFGGASFTVENVSAGGLMIRVQGSSLPNGLVSLKIGPTVNSSIEVAPVWHDQGRHLAGLRILQCDQNWRDYIAYLEHDVRKDQGERRSVA